MRIKNYYILSNDYVVEVQTGDGYDWGVITDPLGVPIFKGELHVLSFDLEIVDQIIENFQAEGIKVDKENWESLPTIIAINPPPPPDPPIIKEYTIEGRVADKNTLEPIQGIKVFISSSLPNNEEPPQDEKIGFETKTNKEGNYELTFKIKTEETTPDVFNVLETPKLQFQSEDNSYGIEKKSPYVGDNSLKTVRSSLDIVQMKPFVSDLKKETTKLQNISANEIEKIKNSIPKDPFQALQKAVSKKIQDILKKFIPLIIAMIAKFGISKLTEAIKNKFSDFDKKNCPHPDELRKIIRKRNRIVKILNSIYKFVDALVKAAGIVLTLIQIFRLIKGIVVSLPIPQAIGVPPAKDFGGLISAQPMSSTLKSANNLDQFESLIKKYEGLTIMILAILSVLKAVLKMAIDLLNGLDAMLQTCMQDAVDKNELQLEIVNQELQDLFTEEKEITPPSPFINGFQILVVEDNKSPIGKLKRRYAIAKNKLGIIMLKGEPSFSSSDQILIDELKFYITQNDLKAN